MREPVEKFKKYIEIRMILQLGTGAKMIEFKSNKAQELLTELH